MLFYRFWDIIADFWNPGRQLVKGDFFWQVKVFIRVSKEIEFVRADRKNKNVFKEILERNYLSLQTTTEWTVTAYFSVVFSKLKAPTFVLWTERIWAGFLHFHCGTLFWNYFEGWMVRLPLLFATKDFR